MDGKWVRGSFPKEISEVQEEEERTGAEQPKQQVNTLRGKYVGFV